jgi:hypothetical protein
VHGFDSFRGLPEDWAGRDGMKKGTFDVNGRKPTVPDNVVLHPGWFNETLPKFILEQLVLVPAPANISVKRLKFRLSGSARKSQKRFRDTPMFKFLAVFVRIEPFKRSNARSERSDHPV